MSNWPNQKEQGCAKGNLCEKATLCSSGWRMSWDLYLGTVLRRTTSCQLSTSERFIPEQAKGWKGQVWPQHLRWGRNLLLPPSTVCCNGGLGKEKAALIMAGTPLSILNLSGDIFQAVPISRLCTSNFSTKCFYVSQYKHLCWGKEGWSKRYKYVEGLDLDEKRWEFAIKWEHGGGEGAQKEMRLPTATLPRVTKCLWFEFNLHSRFIRAPPISRWWGQSQQSYNIGQLDCFMSLWSSQ